MKDNRLFLGVGACIDFEMSFDMSLFRGDTDEFLKNILAQGTKDADDAKQKQEEMQSNFTISINYLDHLEPNFSLGGLTGFDRHTINNNHQSKINKDTFVPRTISTIKTEQDEYMSLGWCELKYTQK